MKNILIFIFFLTIFNLVHAESILEPCKTDTIKNETNCFGKFIFSNGDEYSGEVQNGKANGQGIYIFKSGTKHEGTYKDNRPNGIITSTTADGDVYVGEQKDGINHGQGTITFSNGSKYVGEFKEGKYSGKGTFTHADGKIQKGTWLDNELQEIILSSKEKNIIVITIILIVVSIYLIFYFFTRKGRIILDAKNPKTNFIIIFIIGLSIASIWNFFIFLIDKFLDKDPSIIIVLTILFNVLWGTHVLTGLCVSRVPKIIDKNKTSAIIFRSIGMICFLYYLVDSSMIWINYGDMD